jgi:hypothetical protein
MEVVPELTHPRILKAHFDWVCDGQISDIVAENLGPEIRRIENFLRYGTSISYFHTALRSGNIGVVPEL